jgi:SAM-dependent methyltransferase
VSGPATGGPAPERPALVASARRALALVRQVPARRAARREVRSWSADGFDPWTAVAAGPGAHCNICRWTGPSFGGPAHSEGALCPRCGSIARDRFLFRALQARVDPPAPDRRLRLLETSPRLGPAYRQAMGRWFDYLCSDFDERAHAGMVRIDLQAIDLPTADLDVILTPHVLEHVPDTDRALSELARVLRPGGWLLLQVPLLQGRTAPPAEPEFHGDHTPVFWRFGPGLGAVLAAHGFEVDLLVTADLFDAVTRAGGAAGGHEPWPRPVSPEFDVDDLLTGLAGPDTRDRLTVVADHADAVRHGFEPAYMFVTFAARRLDER